VLAHVCVCVCVHVCLHVCTCACAYMHDLSTCKGSPIYTHAISDACRQQQQQLNTIQNNKMNGRHKVHVYMYKYTMKRDR
jgi:hypothetical protein